MCAICVGLAGGTRVSGRLNISGRTPMSHAGRAGCWGAWLHGDIECAGHFARVALFGTRKPCCCPPCCLQLLGRAENVSSFVRRGTREGWVEITLSAGPGRQPIVIKRSIHANDNESEWQLNGGCLRGGGGIQWCCWLQWCRQVVAVGCWLQCGLQVKLIKKK